MSAQNPPPEQADTGPLEGLRILILEDELLIAMEIKIVVWRLGGTVVGPFPRVPAALEAASSDGIDGAVLDINIAGSMSFAVADALAARGVPLIFCTGYEPGTVVPQHLRDRTILEKPVFPELLAAAMCREIAVDR